MVKIIKIKVLKGAPELVNKIFFLSKKEEGLYLCNKNKIEIVDTWDELSVIESTTSIDSIFNDMHIFSTSFGNELKFIDEVKLIK